MPRKPAIRPSRIAIGREYAFRGGAVEYVAPWVPYAPAGEAVFAAGTADVENLLSLRPDLLFCQGYHLDATSYRNYQTLSRVAPVVPTNLLPWREDLQQVAGWLNREARLAQTFQAYDALRDGLKRKHTARLPTARVAYGSFEPPNLLLRDFDNATGPATQALAELGGRLLPLPVAAERPGFYSVGMENLKAMEAADGILIWAPDETARTQFLQSPLWPLLPAVQAGRAVVSPNNVGQGSVYTVMECLRLWDQVYSALR